MRVLLPLALPSSVLPARSLTRHINGTDAYKLELSTLMSTTVKDECLPYEAGELVVCLEVDTEEGQAEVDVYTREALAECVRLQGGWLLVNDSIRQASDTSPLA